MLLFKFESRTDDCGCQIRIAIKEYEVSIECCIPLMLWIKVSQSRFHHIRKTEVLHALIIHNALKKETPYKDPKYNPSIQFSRRAHKPPGML